MDQRNWPCDDSKRDDSLERSVRGDPNERSQKSEGNTTQTWYHSGEEGDEMRRKCQSNASG